MGDKIPFYQGPKRPTRQQKHSNVYVICYRKAIEKNPHTCKLYSEQMEERINRNVARKVSEEELNSYKGPSYYLSHHEVLKPESTSTPCRIVFNSSAKYQGHILKDYWAKAPDVINDLLGILIRFRDGSFALAGDIRKLYHAVKISSIDQHTHRFLWSYMSTSVFPSTFVMNSVSFGDRPAGAIATVALQNCRPFE